MRVHFEFSDIIGNMVPDTIIAITNVVGFCPLTIMYCV